MSAGAALGFIGLGVMGEPMCRNLVRKAGRPVIAFDARPEPLARLAADGVRAAASVAEVAAAADTILLSLPGEPEVRSVCLGRGGLLAHMRRGQTLVDCSTAPVTLAQSLARDCAAKGIDFADSPVARTRQAAIEGTLSLMVGASAEVFARIEPLLRCMASEVTHCGAPGAGQAVKLLNNMVLAQTVVALAEALAVAKASGAVDPRLLYETLAKSSADSFALRNHGMKSLLPENHPKQAFPVTYMLKDVRYAMALANAAGLDLQGAGTTIRLLEETARLGYTEEYYTAVLEAVRNHRWGQTPLDG
jgi:3-hydroxyisobutyrate dehydrogenase-like beta-hydroxyacid dehydrogenase